MQHLRPLMLMCVLAALLGAHQSLADGIDGVISEGEYPFTIANETDSLQISWHLSGEECYFAVRAQTTGWVAIAFGHEQFMRDADMIIGWVDDQGNDQVLDCYSTGEFGPHPPDTELGGTSDIVSFAVRQGEGVTTMEFKRLLQAADRYDKPLPATGDFEVIWAYGRTDDYRDKHPTAGYAVLNFETTTAAVAETADTVRILLPVHVALMATSFVLLLGGMIVARYFKRKRWWLKTHRLNGMISPMLGVGGVVLGVYMVSLSSGTHIRVIHSVLAVVATALFLLAPVAGLLIFRLKVAAAKRVLRYVHRWAGRSAIVVMLTTIIFGLFQAGIL